MRRPAASQLIAGAIMVVASERRSDLAPMLEVKMPVVLFDREVRDYAGDSVVVDNELAGRLVAEHLLERGFERLACIAGPADVTTTEGRLRGFAATLSAAGRPLAQAHVVRSPLSSSGAGRAVRSLLALDRPPDVVFATTGPLAAGAFQALQEEGLSADGPLALVGHDDDQWMRIVHPAITTVRQPTEVGHLDMPANAPIRSLSSRFLGDENPAPDLGRGVRSGGRPVFSAVRVR